MHAINYAPMQGNYYCSRRTTRRGVALRTSARREPLGRATSSVEPQSREADALALMHRNKPENAPLRGAAATFKFLCIYFGHGL